MLKIKLRDGKEREIQHMMSTSFWSADGKPMSSEEFIQKMFGDLPSLFANIEELRTIWSSPVTRKALLDKLFDLGYSWEALEDVQKIINAEESDLFDVLSYIGFAIKPISRQERVEGSENSIFENLDQKQKEFIKFVLSKYIEDGVEELGEEKLPILLNLKYHTVIDAEKSMGDVERIRETFFEFQKNLYSNFAS